MMTKGRLSALRDLLIKGLIIVALAAVLPLDGFSQRRVTPVEPATPGAPQKKEAVTKTRPSSVIEVEDLAGDVILVDTITGLEFNDSILLPPPPKMIFPLIYQLAVGINVWDPVMRIFGQKNGVADIWAELNMHNRYFPFIDFGLGTCDDTPADANFTFKTPMSPFYKIGCSYNFLYNSNPDYKLLAGLRYGFSHFEWSADDITVDEGYWQDPSRFSITDCKATAGYWEFTLGVRVKIAGNLSMGWNVIYHALLHESKDPLGQPMYIPGFGKRNSAVTGNFSVIYNFLMPK